MFARSNKASTPSLVSRSKEKKTEDAKPVVEEEYYEEKEEEEEKAQEVETE